ncbi:hypothetical protein DFQ11_101795 [Winogradskyella epiphytica]|uniref:3-oxoacyl-ACP synthase n=1 Tax=Winogradskyella epiphytica TaxID=262005 RepID=A0A2V4XIK4_9FLAO|nr:3-oxoacyl-ACP synthase [Winogradskyella epiphytica]PYE83361.1 hypothetical protein DFQ11_101795 [Winogradskyella epiphytica]GGW57632.1 hypothetical protein GCM10008085_06550 [Winogradskyella epiphytica]
MKLKEALYSLCEKFINDRLQTVNNTISEIQISLQSETKSSAGDKHETGRAMLQLEREKAGQQLSEIEKQKQILQKLNPESEHEKVTLGSVVITNQSNYFIAISAGELVVEDKHYYAISTMTPIAQLLISKQVGDEIVFKEHKFIIKEIH